LACATLQSAKDFSMEFLMPRKTFTQEMHEVKDDILLLGSMVENIVSESVQALKDNDLDRSRWV
jgi:phosphate uptake regulator